MKRLVMPTVLAAILATATPIWADHNAAPPAADPERRPGSTTDGSLDIDLKLGLNGFRFGSRLFGREGYAGGAWLNGQTRPDGFSVDGRVERDGHAHNFKMNIQLDEWLRRAAWWWTRGVTDL